MKWAVFFSLLFFLPHRSYFFRTIIVPLRLDYQGEEVTAATTTRKKVKIMRKIVPRTAAAIAFC